MAYWQLYYHLVWATKRREPLLTQQLEADLHKYLWWKAEELGAKVFAVGGIEDHVHMVVAIPPRIAVATCVGQIKGASSHWIIQVSPYKMPFLWQEGYGALTFGKQALARVVEYVNTQAERHRDRRLIAEMERIDGEPDGC